MAVVATDADEVESAAKMPPVCSQRTPLAAKMCCQSKSPGWLLAIAVCPRSEHPTRARTPKPRSVKFRPLRTVLPMPSYGTHRMSEVSTPPCRIRSSSSCPIGFFARRNHRCAHAKAAPKSAGNVVFTSSLPNPKVSSRMDAFFSGIEPQHYLAEADAVPLATFSCFHHDRVHGSILAGSRIGIAVVAYVTGNHHSV
jgi:hypothetical protein